MCIRDRFHDRRTYARSRCRCSRPEHGQPKVPFSLCRCHLLVIDYRRGSIGSDETATATPGGPRVIAVFRGNGAPSGPKAQFLWWQIGSWRLLKVGLVVGKRVYRIRRRCGSLVLSESPGSKPWPKAAKAPRAAERNRPKMPEAAAHAA